MLTKRASATLSALTLSLGLGVAFASAGHAATLVDVVQTATAQFQDPEAAVAAGWMSTEACVSGPEKGAMGIHYVNTTLFDGALDPERPEALIYEEKNGRRRLVGVEFIELADVWDAVHAGPPVLLGQQFHYVGSPNRYGLPPFYELHVWTSRPNPHGTFADWNPNVRCDHFPGG